MSMKFLKYAYSLFSQEVHLKSTSLCRVKIKKIKQPSFYFSYFLSINIYLFIFARLYLISMPIERRVVAHLCTN